MGTFIFLIILIVIFNSIFAKKPAKSNHRDSRSQQSDAYRRQIEEARRRQMQTQAKRTRPVSAQHLCDDDNHGESVSPRVSPTFKPSSGHLCEDGQHSEEVEPVTRVSLSAKDDLTVMVDEINREHEENDEYLFGTMRSKRLTAEEMEKKKEELRALLSAGIISSEEYHSILKEYSRFSTR